MTSKRQRGRPLHPDVLTPAEWRVAEGVRHGLTNRQIASLQKVSMDAVKFHVGNILGKLGLESREDLRLWQGIDAESSMAGENMVSCKQTIDTIGQVARTVSNIEAARHFYGEVLGLPHLFDAGTLAFYQCGQTRLMLSEGEAGPESILYFKVDALHDQIARIEKAGVKVVSAPHKIHTHDDGREEWMGFVEDTDGRPIGLMALVAPAA